MTIKLKRETREISIYRGDTPTLEATFTDEDGNPIDLTDATVYIACRKETVTGDVLFNKTCTVTNATQGQVEVKLTSTETDYVGKGIGEFEARYVDGTILNLSQLIIIFKEEVRD